MTIPPTKHDVTKLWQANHTCHIYHILSLNMTHMIGMTAVPKAKGLPVGIFISDIDNIHFHITERQEK